MHTLEKTITLPITLHEAWDFFSDPKNLKKITPEYMKFEITSGNAGEKVYPGMVIRYHVRPFLNIKMNWTTEITHLRDYSYFVDNQLDGPYSIWNHQHHFKEVDSGVEMTDILFYKIPFGPLGRLANWLFVRRQVRKIFKYRERVLSELFAR